ncbi:bile acid:sodium symporter family protein [Succinivibrio dextrinosolvens]|uniref:bile acid:sodium symporter family protein n=1 Tax=Succinivibrio dextrinosolvens TaxID=83771 RepID=UPI0024794AED|nr:bile acid:sodium symporter family protein [Succinivibrio dextrinosolvens]
MSLLITLSRILAKYTALFVIGTAVFAYFVPSSCTFVKGNTQIIILGIIMLSMGMTLGRQDYRILAQRPFDILIGTIAQFTIMPLIAIALATTFNLSDGLTLGLVLVGCCPGGVSSNIMTFLCKGDVAFSVGMTTVSTIIAPVATPLLVNYLVGQRIDIDGWSMFQFMLMVTIIPVGIGSFCNIIFGKFDFFKKIRQIMPGVAVIGFALIVGGVIAYHGQKFLESGLVIFLCIFCHNALGYLLGFFAGRTFKMSTAKKRTLAIEVGVQNAGLATGLCGKFFPTSAEAAIASAVSCVWHSISGTILANIFATYDKKKAEGSNNLQTSTEH